MPTGPEPLMTARAELPAAPPSGLKAVDGRTFPLRGAKIRARAEGGVARTTFAQSYTNPYTEPLEVLYTLPLPADGSVIGYTVHLGEKVITGHIERREEARKAYQRALEEGRTAGLLEQERADTFTQSLGSLPPGSDVRVEIDVLHPLAFQPGAGDGRPPEWEYRFPTVVGVRYEGAPGRVPDAARLDVERADQGGTPARLELELEVADGDPARIAIESTSHRVRAERRDDSPASLVTLVEPAPLDRDLVVRWIASESGVGLHLRVGAGLEGDDGRYGLLTLTPPAIKDATFARDLTLLIDASGSMAGTPIKRAKQVAAHLLRSLTERDRFEFTAFSSKPVELVRGPEAATDGNVRKALEILDALEAGGATEMADAVDHALRPLRHDSQRQVVLLTDGYIGFEDEVIGKVLANLPEGARLHTVGIGSAPNRTLTMGAARAGRGVELLVGEGRLVEGVVERLRRATVAPVLTDLTIGGSAVHAVAPERPRDVLAGQPLLVAVELKSKAGTIEVSGRLAGEPERWSARLEVEPAGIETKLPVGALFGREAIEDQEMLLAASGRGFGNPEAILKRIENLGLRHRIASRRTSLVAVSEDPTVDPKDPRRRQRLAVELPAEVSAEGVGLAPMMLDPAMRGITGLTLARPCIESSRPPARIGFDGEAVPRSVRSRILSAIQKLRLPDQAEAPYPGAEVLARTVRVEGDLLVVEFEAPEDGFTLPSGGEGVDVRLDDGRKLKARVEATVSTREGPHDGGLTLRLGLRTADGSAWPAGTVRIQWVSAGLPVTMTVRIVES